MALHGFFSAFNAGPSPHLLPSRQTRPACCPPFSTSIISTPAGWAGWSAIGGCSSPPPWNSLRPSTTASEAEQPPVWADCGGRRRETGRRPHQLLPAPPTSPAPPPPACSLFVKPVHKQRRRKNTKYIWLYVCGHVEVLAVMETEVRGQTSTSEPLVFLGSVLGLLYTK